MRRVIAGRVQQLSNGSELIWGPCITAGRVQLQFKDSSEHRWGPSTTGDRIQLQLNYGFELCYEPCTMFLKSIY